MLGQHRGEEVGRAPKSFESIQATQAGGERQGDMTKGKRQGSGRAGKCPSPPACQDPEPQGPHTLPPCPRDGTGVLELKLEVWGHREGAAMLEKQT